jgi:hypothetical protein
MSPYADATQDWLGDWLRAVWPQADDDIRQRMERVGFARYAARLYPDAEPAVLRTLSGLFTWFFLLDDTADTSSAPDPAWLRGLVTESLAVLRHGPTVSHRREGLHRLLAEAWRNPHAAMPDSWRHRFIDAVQHHLGGVLLETEAKSLGRHPTVEGYIQLRRATSAGYVAHVLTEYAVRAPLPDSIHGHPAVRAYSTAGNDLLSWFNDLLSLDRDAATAGGHNLVLALAAERHLCIGEALEAAVTRWQHRMDGLAALRAAVPSFGPALDVSVRHYLDGVDRSVRGTIDWSLETARYQLPPLVAAHLS